MRLITIETKLGHATIDVDDISVIFDETGDYLYVSFKNGLQQAVRRDLGERVRSLWLGRITLAEWHEQIRVSKQGE